MTDTKYEQVPAAAVVHVDANKVADSSRRPSLLWRLFKFCLFLLLACTLVCVVLLGAAFYGGSRVINAMGEIVVPQITSDVPLNLPQPVYLSEEEATELHQRIHEFKHAIHHGRAPSHDLILTEHEINGLICDEGGHGRHHGHRHEHHNRHRGEMCGNVHVTVSDQQVNAAISVPLDDHVPGGEGRYFVGHKFIKVARTDEATFDVRTALLAGGDSGNDFPLMNLGGTIGTEEDGTINIQAKSAEIFGWAATDQFLERFLSGRNLADGMLMCPHAKKHATESLKFIKAVEIGDGKIVVKVHPQEEEEEEVWEEEEEEDVGVDFGLRNLRLPLN